MNQLKTEELRERFYAEINIKETSPEYWENYALWLEKQSNEKINNELIWQNQLFRKAYEKVIEVLQLSLISKVG